MYYARTPLFSALERSCRATLPPFMRSLRLNSAYGATLRYDHHGLNKFCRKNSRFSRLLRFSSSSYPSLAIDPNSNPTGERPPKRSLCNQLSIEEHVNKEVYLWGWVVTVRSGGSGNVFVVLRDHTHCPLQLVIQEKVRECSVYVMYRSLLVYLCALLCADFS